MHYNVTFQVDGNERTESVDAPDAASAVTQIQAEHGRTSELFELIQVQLLDDASAETSDDVVQARATS